MTQTEYGMRHGQQAETFGKDPIRFIVHCVLCGEEMLYGEPGEQVAIFSNGTEQYIGCGPCIEAMGKALIRVRQAAIQHDKSA